MKHPQYIEGQKALENFERFASAVLQANPKSKGKGKKKATPSSSVRKPRKSDKD